MRHLEGRIDTLEDATGDLKSRMAGIDQRRLDQRWSIATLIAVLAVLATVVSALVAHWPLH